MRLIKIEREVGLDGFSLFTATVEINRQTTVKTELSPQVFASLQDEVIEFIQVRLEGHFKPEQFV